jgi:hypothetical protein
MTKITCADDDIKCRPYGVTYSLQGSAGYDGYPHATERYMCCICFLASASGTLERMLPLHHHATAASFHVYSICLKSLLSGIQY